MADEENTGDTCILEIKNSRGNVFGYNETVFNAENSGLWKRKVFGCDHFIAAGESGRISFENIGPVDDVIQILARSSPEAGNYIISSQPGSIRNVHLRSDEEGTIQNYFYPGNIIFRKLFNWGVTLGIISVLLVIFLLIPEAFFIKIGELIDRSRFPRLMQKFRLICIEIWSRLDSKEAAIASIIFLFFAGVFISFFITNRINYGPTHFGDEIRYWETAHSIYKGDFTTEKFYRSPPFYPLTLLPAFYLFYPFGSYPFSKLLNAIYLTSAIIPAFFLLRKFTKRNISIVAISLLLLNPVQLMMPGLILSENVFYPIFMWTVLFSFTNVFPDNLKNRVIESLLLGVLIGLLFLTRYIALGLIPAFLFIWWLKPFENEKPPFLFSIKKLMFFILVLIPIVLIMAGWITAGTAEGMQVKDMIGLFIADKPNPDQLSFSRLFMWTIFYCSYTVLVAAPFFPLLLITLSKFKLKNWREDENRWLIIVATLILFLLAACIRHSWRINYNYPIPIKLQGRYLLYFGPLFLITIFSVLKKRFKILNPWKLIAYSSVLITFSYAILFSGLFFLDGPLRISRSSPDGDLIEAMGIIFVLLTIANVITNSLLLNRRKITFITSIVVFLFGFFLFGNVKIFQTINNSKDQLLNSQVSNLIEVRKELNSEELNNNISQMVVVIPSDTDNRRILLLRQTLIFNGYRDFVLRKTNIAETDPALVFQAITSNYLINLRNLTEEEYLSSTNKKYFYSEKFFEFQIFPNKLSPSSTS